MVSFVNFLPSQVESSDLRSCAGNVGDLRYPAECMSKADAVAGGAGFGEAALDVV